jgi:uncharacterized protein YabE (DUF348 family)
MKVQLGFELDISAKATYKDGKVNVSVSGTMPISERSDRQVTATVEGASKKTQDLFKEAFEALIAEQQEQVVKRARAGSSEALAVAIRMGEL